MLFSHIFVSVTDFDRALEFYTAVMQVLGNERRFCEPAKPWAGWEYYANHDGAYFRDPDGNKVCVASHGEQ
jgi:catechol 2,3-dioxygenase-like lactoylglutathione lyase family enzyme